MGKGTVILSFAVAFLLLSLVPALYSDESKEDPLEHIFSSTTYYNSTTLYVTDNITVESGETLIFDDTTVYFNCSSDYHLSIYCSLGGSLIIRNGSYLTLNRTGNYSDNSGYNYRILSSGSLVIKDSEIEYAGHTGYESTSGLYSEGQSSLLENVTFYGTSVLLVVKGDRSHIMNCSFEGSLSYALKVRGDKLLVDGCRFIDCDTSIANTNQGNLQYSMVSNNTITTGKYGIVLGCQNCTVKDNELMNISEYGLALTGNYYNKKWAYSERNYLDNCSIGIRPWGSNVEMNNNTITNSARTGIETHLVSYQYGTDFVMNGNNIMNCSTGIGLYSYKGDKIINNSISNCSTGIHFLGHNDPYLVGNSFKMISDWGIYINRSSNIILKDNSFINSGNGVKIQGGIGSIIEENEFIHLENGLCIWNHQRAKIWKNSIMRCQNGLNITGNGGSEIERNSLIECTTGLSLKGHTSKVFAFNEVKECNIGISINSTSNIHSIRDNNFMGNVIHAQDEITLDYHSGTIGNYWTGMDNYTDMDDDGIVDFPYWIDDNSRDKYPLVYPWGTCFNQPVELTVPYNETVMQFDTFKGIIEAFDPDPDEISIEILPDPVVNFIFDQGTGNFSFTPDEEVAGDVVFSVIATDNNGSTVIENFTITVIHYNWPPEYTGPDPIETYTDVDNRIDLLSHDRNGDNVAIFLSTRKSFPFQIYVSENRYLVFNCPRGYAGEYLLELRLDDNNGSRTDVEIELIVHLGNLPPEIKPVSDQEVKLGYLFTIDIEAYDPEGDPISYNMTYSGEGDHRITDEGSIMIEPVPSDVGIQRVRAIVSDSKGANSTVGFDLEVILVNSPPEGILDYSFKVAAGDIARFPLELKDPEGDHIVFLEYGGEPPEWVSFDDAEMELVARPSLEDIGRHEFMAAASDDGSDPVLLKFNIKVIKGTLSPLNVPLDILITEGESRVIALDFEYGLNGTKFLELEEISPCINVQDNIVRINTRPGDNGTHSILVNYGIVNGVTRTSTINVHVKLNTSLIDVGVTITPAQEIYEYGDRISMHIDLNGVEGSMSITWMLSVSDMTITLGSGPDIIVTLDMVGTWELDIFLNDNPGAVHTEEIIVVDRPETAGGDGLSTTGVVLITIFATLLILIISLVIFTLIRRKRDHETDKKDEQFWLDGFKAAPPVDASHLEGKMPEPISEKDYTPGEPSKPHDVTDRSGKSGDTGFS